MSPQDSVKTKTPSKKRKASAKQKFTSPSHDEIARLAEQYWIERGRLHGSAEQDWLRAESELIGMAS